MWGYLREANDSRIMHARACDGRCRSAQLHGRLRPTPNFIRFEQRGGSKLHVACRGLAVRDGNQEIAAMRHGDADPGMPRAILHAQLIRPEAAGHPGEADRLAWPQRRKARADQIEIADTIDLVVIGDAAVAIAEAEFGPDIDCNAAALAFAAEGAAGGPAVAQKRPGDLPPC